MSVSSNQQPEGGGTLATTYIIPNAHSIEETDKVYCLLQIYLALQLQWESCQLHILDREPASLELYCNVLQITHAQFY